MIDRRQPRAFTLVEMMVASALVLFTMVILSEAFTAGLESFRQLKSIGDMNTRLRGAVTLLRDDLRADHFGTHTPLSQTSPSAPPAQGFFRIMQGSPPTYEGTDPDGIESYRGQDAMLHFTVNLGVSLAGLSAIGPGSFLSAPVPAGSPLLPYGPAALQTGNNYSSQWAEVVYFLRPNGSGASGTPLYALYRRQKLLYTQNGLLSDLNVANPIGLGLLSQYSGISGKPNPLLPGFLHLNTPADVTFPGRRFGMQTPPLGLPVALLSPFDPSFAGQLTAVDPVTAKPTYPTARDDSPMALWGSDLVLTDVVSFEVKVSTGGDLMDLFHPTLQPLIYNPAFAGAGNPRVFDTWSGANDGGFDYTSWLTPGTYKSMPMAITVKAMQITVRVWDVKTQKTRQVTLVQDM